jgi:hypothetical protein
MDGGGVIDVQRRMNGRRILVAAVGVLIVLMGVLMISRAWKARSADAAAELAEDLPPASQELLRVERESAEAGVPLEPARAREKMREAMAAPEQNVRAKMAGEIIRDLCAAGFVDEAWQMVDTAKGQVRDLELMAFFRYGKLDPLELLDRVGELQGPVEIRRALDGYLSAGTLEDVHGVMALPGFAGRLKELEAGYPKDMEPVISALVRDRLRAARSDEERNAVGQFTRRMLDLKAVSPELWMEVTKVDDQRDAYERWEEVRKITAAEGLFQEGDSHRGEMLEKLVTDDGTKAMTLLTPHDDRQGRVDLADAMRRWYAKNWPAVGAWLEENAEKLSEAQRDAVYAALAKHEASAGNAAKAQTWAEKIADEMLRKELLPVK